MTMESSISCWHHNPSPSPPCQEDAVVGQYSVPRLGLISQQKRGMTGDIRETLCELWEQKWDWLVVWNIFYFPIYWVANHPNWRSYFSEGWPNHQPGEIPLIQHGLPGRNPALLGDVRFSHFNLHPDLQWISHWHVWLPEDITWCWCWIYTRPEEKLHCFEMARPTFGNHALNQQLAVSENGVPFRNSTWLLKVAHL